MSLSMAALSQAVHYDAEAERTRLMKEKAKKIKKLKEASNKLKKKDSKLHDSPHSLY